MAYMGDFKEHIKEMEKKATAQCIECGEYHDPKNVKDGLCEECQKAYIMAKKECEKVKKVYSDIDSGAYGNPRVPKRYAPARLSDFSSDITSKVETWAKNGSDVLLIQSPKAGTGKTHLGASALYHYVNRNRESGDCKSIVKKMIKDNEHKYNFHYGENDNFSQYHRKHIESTAFGFFDFVGLMGIIRGTYDKDSEKSERGVIDHCAGVGVLVIDDIGAEKTSEYTQAIIYEIVNRRYNNMMPTIITTNLTANEITESYGGRMLSRFASGTIIKLDGKDRRLV